MSVIFSPFPTNPTPALTPPHSTMMQYLEHVLRGQGRSLCPFVPMVHERNGYHLAVCSVEPDKLDFAAIIAAAVTAFWQTSPTPTQLRQTVDVTTLIVAFVHEQAQTPNFCRTIEAVRNDFRLQVLQQGLMLAHMTPTHADPKGGQRYVAGIPLLMVRRMHEQDHVFMLTAAERSAYEGFFGSRPWR